MGQKTILAYFLTQMINLNDEIIVYTTQRAIEKLKSLKIVQEVSGGKRNRVYCAQSILKILEEPAKISARV